MAPYDILVKIKSIEDFSGGPVIKNPSAIAGDTGLVPNPGRLHALRGNKAHAPQLLTLHPVLGTARSLHGEGAVHRGTGGLAHHSWRKPSCSMEGHNKERHFKKACRKFPSDLLVRIPGFYCPGPDLTPSWGPEILQAALHGKKTIVS